LNQAHTSQKSPPIPPFLKGGKGGFLEMSDTSRGHLIFVVLYREEGFQSLPVLICKGRKPIAAGVQAGKKEV
jgi:hypothetical protein